MGHDPSVAAAAAAMFGQHNPGAESMLMGRHDLFGAGDGGSMQQVR